MAVRSLLLTILSFYCNQCTSQSNIHCVSGTEWGSARFSYQGNHVNLTCGDIGYPNYTMIDCEGLTTWRNLRGSIINYDEVVNSDICYVEKTVDSFDTDASLGYINCCDMNLTNLKNSQNIEITNIIPSNTSISCTQRESTSTTTVYDNNSEIYYSTVECGINETLLSCHGVVLNDKRTYGTCIGRNCFDTDSSNNSTPDSGTFIPSDNVCHVTSKFNSNITAQATCCKLENSNTYDNDNNTNTSDYNLNDLIECNTIWSESSAGGDGTVANISCNDGEYNFNLYNYYHNHNNESSIYNYTLFDCNAMKTGDGSSAASDGVYYDNYNRDTQPAIGVESTRCYARNSGWSSYGIYSQALCCRFKGISTYTSTLTPTIFPTVYPTPNTKTRTTTTQSQTTRRRTTETSTSAGGVATYSTGVDPELARLIKTWEIGGFVVMIGSLIIPFLIVFIGKWYEKMNIQRFGRIDKANYFSVFAAFWNFGDFWSDLMFCMILVLSDNFLWYYGVLFSFLPHFVSNFLLLYNIGKWSNENVYVAQYVGRYDWLIICISCMLLLFYVYVCYVMQGCGHARLNCLFVFLFFCFFFCFFF